ncbi:hypothetical protein N9S44_02790 [Gammaproteobacteria bacterium]|jgi:hypothetical protein|nr:hypothetical protein [Gammaproteobacteria bacterium]
MKKLVISLVAIFSINTYANNMVGINYNDIDGFSGIGVSLSGSTSKFVYDFDIMDLDDNTVNVLHLGYAIGDVSEGSFYVGLVSMDSDVADSRETEPELGYVVRGNDGVQWKVGLLLGDFEETIDAEVQIPVGQGNVELGLMHDDEDSLITVGYSWNF